MSIPGTWCDHRIIQAVANAFNCVIHITESNANSLQATIISCSSAGNTADNIYWVY